MCIHTASRTLDMPFSHLNTRHVYVYSQLDTGHGNIPAGHWTCPYSQQNTHYVNISILTVHPDIHTIAHKNMDTKKLCMYVHITSDRCTSPHARRITQSETHNTIKLIRQTAVDKVLSNIVNTGRTRWDNLELITLSTLNTKLLVLQVYQVLSPQVGNSIDEEACAQDDLNHPRQYQASFT